MMNTTARILFTALGLFTAISPFAADWNETHIYNPLWTPHAKFHNAQTMLFGAALGLLTLAFAWMARPDRRQVLVTAIFAGLYWLTQALSITFPDTALADPEPQGLAMPVVWGLQLTQLHMDVVLLALVVVASVLALRRPR